VVENGGSGVSWAALTGSLFHRIEERPAARTLIRLLADPFFALSTRAFSRSSCSAPSRASFSSSIAGTRDALLVALAPVFGTYLLVYSKEFFSELLMALGVASPSMAGASPEIPPRRLWRSCLP
jgi:hypothetical protein